MSGNVTIPYLNIVVYKGDPLEYREKRRTALWLRFRGFSPDLLVRIVGDYGSLMLSVAECDDLSEHIDTKRRTIGIGPLTSAIPPDELLDVVRNVPVNNKERDSNSHTWVISVLGSMDNMGWLMSEDWNRAFDKMMDALNPAEPL